MKPVIAVSTGDPFGVGPEISLLAACHSEVRQVCRPLLVGDRHLLLGAARSLRLGATHSAAAGGAALRPGAFPASVTEPLSDPEAWPEVSISGFAEMGSKQGADFHVEDWKEGPAFLDMGEVGPVPEPRGPSAAGGRAAIKFVKQALGLVRFGSAAALATAPISKSALKMAGHPWPGHTELLADLSGADPAEVAMLFVTPDLKVALLSVHESLSDAIKGLTAERVVQRLALLHVEHERWFGTTPRLALCALNPHAGEEGMFGREERDILAPAVDAARDAGVDVRGPFPADTLFPRAARGDFDLVLALHHDQGTIAVKARSFGHAVNMTLGLPFLRTSVDHGTAWDIAGTGTADPSSLTEAILLAARLAPRAGPSQRN